MKSKLNSFVFLFVLLFSTYLFAQDNSKNMESIPEEEKAAALLKLAKQNYTSNYIVADDYSLMALLIAEKLKQKKEMGIANKYLGITDYFRRDFEAALQHYKKAMQIFEEAGELKEQANVINNIALIYSESGDYKTSIVYHEQSLAIREEQNDAKGIIGSLNNIGNLYLSQGDYKKSLEKYEKALEISRLVFPDEHFATLIGSLARNHVKLGNTEEALLYFIDAIKVSKQDNDQRGVVINQINLGNFYFDLGSTEKAITYFTDALNIASKNNMEYLEGVARLNIGNTYYQSEQFLKASEFYKSSLTVYEKTSDIKGQIKGLINVALCNEKLGLPDSAQQGFLYAQQISELYGEPRFLAMTENYLGKYYLNNDKIQESLKWLTSAFIVATKNNITRELYMSNFNLGNYWFNLSDYNKSLAYYQTALRISVDMESVIFQKDASEGLWQSLEKLKNYDEAFEALLAYNALKDSIFNQEKQKQIIAVKGKLNLSLKENQISSQRQIIAQQEKILQQEKWNKVYITSVAVLVIILLIIIFNREKIRRQKEKAELIQKNLTTEHDLLQLQMNPHFIFNALNSIQSFISVNNSFEAELFLSKFARLMRYYLDSSSHKWVDFTDELQAIELNLELEKLRLNNKFEFKVIVDDSIEVDEIQLPPMLLQPFIENAVKHGLRPMTEKGTLEIGFMMQKNNIYCYIEDNGIGREAAMKSKKVSSTHKSKGMELTKSRLATMFKRNENIKFLEIKDMKDKNSLPIGTRVELLIPIRYF